MAACTECGARGTGASHRERQKRFRCARKIGCRARDHCAGPITATAPPRSKQGPVLKKPVSVPASASALLRRLCAVLCTHLAIAVGCCTRPPAPPAVTPARSPHPAFEAVHATPLGPGPSDYRARAGPGSGSWCPWRSVRSVGALPDMCCIGVPVCLCAVAWVVLLCALSSLA